MQAPVTVSVRDVNRSWHVVDALPPTWSTVAPGGCFDATITLRDGAKAPELQQGCLVRITTADSAEAVWAGRLSQPVRRVLGSQTQWELPVEGTAAWFADRRLKYRPAVTGFDAWELSGTTPVGPYRGGATVQSGSVPFGSDDWKALLLQLPGGYIVGNDKVLARFTGFDDTTMTAHSMRGWHVEGAWSAHQDQFFSFLWHGQPKNMVQLILPATFGADRYFQAPLASKIADIVLGFQFLGPPTNTNDSSSSIKSSELWAAFYGLTVWARLFDVDGSYASIDPLNDGLRSADVVRDMIGRGFMPAASQNESVTRIDASSSVQITSLDYGDSLVTAADVLNDLVGLEPNYRWMAGAADASTGDVPVSWDTWPDASEALLLPPGVVVYDEQGSDDDLANAVTFTYRGESGTERSQLLTVDVFDFPDTLGLGAGHLVEAPPLDLTGLRSYSAALQVATAYLAMYATLPRSATARVSVPVVDRVTGELVAPWHVVAGRVAHVPETGDTLRVTKVEVDASTATATLTLGTPRKTVADLVAAMSNRRKVN